MKKNLWIYLLLIYCFILTVITVKMPSYKDTATNAITLYGTVTEYKQEGNNLVVYIKNDFDLPINKFNIKRESEIIDENLKKSISNKETGIAVRVFCLYSKAQYLANDFNAVYVEYNTNIK